MISFFVTWYIYKLRKYQVIVFNSVGEQLKKKASFFSIENDFKILNKSIIATFDNNYYVHEVKILYLSPSELGGFVRVTISSDISVTFTLTLASGYYVSNLLDRMSREEVFSRLDAYFKNKGNNNFVFQKYLPGADIFPFFRAMGNFSNLISIRSSKRTGTSFKVYLHKVDVLPILSAIAFFEKIIQIVSRESRELVVAKNLEDKLIFQHESII